MKTIEKLNESKFNNIYSVLGGAEPGTTDTNGTSTSYKGKDRKDTNESEATGTNCKCDPKAKAETVVTAMYV